MKMNEGPVEGASVNATPAADRSSLNTNHGADSTSAQPQDRSTFISPDHQELLAGSAISEAVYLEAGVRSILRSGDLPEECSEWQNLIPGLLFRRDSVRGGRSWQYRPDQPDVRDGRVAKYLSLAGDPPVLVQHPWMKQAVANPMLPLVIVEGTKQYLAAVSALGPSSSFAAVGMSGCWGWSHDGMPSPDLISLSIRDREVLVVMDADLGSNPHVFDAAKRLQEVLTTLRGAKQVKFVRLPAGSTAGLDDVLAVIPEQDRPLALKDLLDSAEARLGPRPKKQIDDFHGSNGPRMSALADDICSAYELAVGLDHEVWVYRDGVFVPDSQFLVGEVARRLGDSYRTTHVSSVKDIIRTSLRDQGRVIPDRPGGRWLNVRNGMLDPLTETLQPHSPEYLSVTQFPVEWNPDARAPQYEKWLTERVGPQIQDLEESMSMMIEPDRTPHKAILLFGPSRSGKSTLQRLAAAIAGEANVSSVTLHDLTSNRFAAANLLGKILNTAADLSSRNIEDLEKFKQVTGGDLITAERKNEQQFTFTNRALLLFSANTIPSVAESSNAYLERMRPFEFGVSFAGAEDPGVEDRLMDELPGILTRWVRALQVRRARGSFLPIQPDVRVTFEVGSDQVRAFLDEMTVYDDSGMERARLYEEYKDWARESGLGTLNKTKFFARLRSAGVEEYRHRDRGYCFRLRIVDPFGIFLPGDPGFPEFVYPPDKRRDKSDTFPPLTIPPDVPHPDTHSSKPEWEKTVTTVTGPGSGLWTDTSCHPGSVYLPDRASNSSQSHIAGATFPLIGHGLMTARLSATCSETGLTPKQLTDRCHDLLLLARLDDPAPGGERPRAVAASHSLQALARRFSLEWNDDPRIQEGIIRELAERFPMTAYGKREHRVMGIVGEMRLKGFRVDETRLDRLLRTEDLRRTHLIEQLAGEGLPLHAVDGSAAKDPLNTKAGREFLVQRLSDLEVSLRCKPSGEIDLSKDALLEVIDGLNPSHPARVFASLIIEVRSGSPVLHQVKGSLVEGRVHPFIDASQATGRFSVTRPGLTVMHKDFGREVFVPEPGHVIITADLSQIDARAIAAHCQDPGYLALFEDGRDFHAEVAERVLGSTQHRSIAKVINHATSYGAGAGLIAKTAGVGLDDARQFLRDMEAAYPLWAAWRRDTVERARSGELLDNGFSRRVRPNPGRIETTAVAIVGQACARDLLVECLFRLDDKGLTPNLRMIVHDEVVLSVPKDIAQDVQQTIRECMSFDWAPPSCEIPVPIRATVSEGRDSWSAVK